MFPIVARLGEHGGDCDRDWQTRKNSWEKWFELTTPISVNARQDSPLAESNFAAAQRLIDAASSFGIGYRWDLWAGGQIKTLTVRADDAGALRELQGIVAALEDYPILDESDLSEREWEAAHPAHDDLCYSDDDDCGCQRGRA